MNNDNGSITSGIIIDDIKKKFDKPIVSKKKFDKNNDLIVSKKPTKNSVGLKTPKKIKENKKSTLKYENTDNFGFLPDDMFYNFGDINELLPVNNINDMGAWDMSPNNDNFELGNFVSLNDKKNSNTIKTFEISEISDNDHDDKNVKFKLSLPFDSLNIKMKTNNPSYFSINPISNPLLVENENQNQNQNGYIMTELRMPSKYHSLIVPVDVGNCENKSSILVNLSGLGKFFNATLLGDMFLSFDNNKCEIEKIYLFYNQDNMIDSIDYDMINILKKFSDFEIMENLIRLPFFNKYESRGILLNKNNKDFKLLIKTKSPIKDTKIELYITLFYLSQGEIFDMKMSNLNQSYMFLQYGKNSLFHNKKITNKTVSIPLKKFNGEIAEIWIIFSFTKEKKENINPTCLLKNNNNVVSVIDKMINKINFKKIYNYNYKDEDNVYYIPFCLCNPHLNISSSGSMKVQDNNLSLEIKFNNTENELNNLEIKIYAPRYNIINFVGDNVKLLF